MLSRLYKYAHITYVGGGFTKDGVHNVLEAAVYGKPVLFGNNYNKYREAVDLVKAGGANKLFRSRELYKTLMTLLNKSKMTTKRNAMPQNNMYGEIRGLPKRF